MTELRDFFYNSPLGCIRITMSGNAITGITFSEKPDSKLIKPDTEPKAVIDELNEYFSGKRKNFTLKISLTGTCFEMAVWNLLRKVPYGKTLSYSEVGHLLGNRNYARAVGNACNKNPIAIIVPCHRVVPKNGKFVGKYVYGSKIKQALIELEKSNL